MKLQLKNITIKNFKSCANLTLDLSQFSPLIGYNNAGKSNCLTAIQWLLRKNSATEKDFYDPNNNIEIEGEIAGITDTVLGLLETTHKRNIEKYVHHETLKIKRVQERPSVKTSEIKLYVWKAETQDWALNPTGIDNAISKLLPEPIRIGAMEDAAEDVTKHKNTTTIGKLLNLLVSSIKEKYETEIAQHLEQVSSHLAYDGADRFNDLKVIDQSVNTKIKNFFPGVGIKLHFETPSFEDLFKSGTIKVVDENESIQDFSNYGHGAQRSIQMALIQYLAEIKNEQDVGTTILLIDEPELYLHPFAIEQIREALLELSNQGYQIIISTHSAQMITPELAENALLIRKEDGKTIVRNSLKKAINNTIKQHQHQAELLFTLSHASQILFADKVLLVEGKTENKLLPFIFHQIHNKTLGQYKYALIPVEGASNINKTLEILSVMGLPAKAITDLDFLFKDAIDGNLLSESDLINCKEAMMSCADGYGIEMNSTDKLPIKKHNMSKAKALEMLATNTEVQNHIHILHDQLKNEHNIWVWKSGAIEAPLGLKEKTDREWASFRQRVKETSLSDVCNDYSTVYDLIEWIVK